MCPGDGGLLIPPGGEFDHVVSEDEAVAFALWNNAAFNEALTDLKLARADLIQAGLLPNPEFAWWFGVTDKPFKYLFDFPIESLWLRPVRLKAARRESERTCDRLVQAALDLIRDTRQAYADVLLARERLRVAEEAVKQRQAIADIAEKRLKAGDVSPQEAAAARIDALTAREDAVRAGYEVPIAEERLRQLMGLGQCRGPLQLDPADPVECAAFDADALAELAAATRPDALAAAEFAEAAHERLRLARRSWARLLGIGDATSGRESHVLGPALRFTVPIFNQGQGQIARAKAEQEKADRARWTLHDQIVLEVRRAALQYQQACAELDALRRTVLPEVEANIRRTQKAYDEGATNYLIVLEATRQQIDAAGREAQLRSARRRALAELERSVGQHLDGATRQPTRQP